MMKSIALLLGLAVSIAPVPASFCQAQSAVVPVSASQMETVDFSDEFGALNGTAVFYDPARARYAVYQPALSEKRSSPCSTFKIVSAYVGLMTGVIDPAHSLRRWNGTTYWLEQWNKDISLKEAFGCSCIWYFRQVIDDMGPDAVQSYLDRLSYGNRDCSDWSGALNTNEPLYDLKGFWLESSLKISPREQTEVLSRIFTESPDPRKQAAQAVMKSIMLVESDEKNSLAVYGKTGFGVTDGKPVDAWFVGFYTRNGHPVYFAVRLDDPDNPASTSAAAKQIALSIIRTRRDVLPF